MCTAGRWWPKTGYDYSRLDKGKIAVANLLRVGRRADIQTTANKNNNRLGVHV